MARDDQQILDQLRRQRAKLADFGLYAFRCDNVDEMLEEAARAVSQVLSVDLVKVLEHLPDRSGMLIRSGVNWDPGVVGKVTLGDDSRSPAGFALENDGAVISRDISTETRFGIPEVLVRHGVKSMVNVAIAGEQRPFGVLEVDAREHRDFDEDDIACLRTYANLLAAGIGRIRAHHKLRDSAAEQEVLARELGHRMRNVLSVVQALASQTSVDVASAKEYRQAFMGRLQALSHAETLIFGAEGEKVDPAELARAVLGPYLVERPETVAIKPAPARLTARSGRMVGLALHELATNAAKHGALSVPEGRVSISWTLRESEAGPRLRLRWEERGGPAVEPPDRKGFGTRLLEDVVSQELKGTAELSHRPEGFSYQLVFPVDAK